MRDDSFKVSSFCTSGGCLGVDIGDDGVRLKELTGENGAELRITRDEWAAFVDGVKNGEFDL